MLAAMMMTLLAGQAISQPAVTGDFDRDGRPDSALIERSAAGKLSLIVRHGSGATSTVDADIGDATNFYFDRASPGQVATACADPRASRAACPGTALPSGDGLLFGTREASGAVALWTGKRFESVWISD